MYTQEDQEVIVEVAKNDFDLDGSDDDLFVNSIVSNPSHGTVEVTESKKYFFHTLK